MIKTRRAFLQMMFGGQAPAPGAARVVAAAPASSTRDILVVVFLRGAADGLSLVAPHTDADYYKARPLLAINRPDQGAAASRLRDLDGQFGFHPGLDPLLPFFKDGTLGVVHAVGSDDKTRSHFEAQDLMEHGLSATGHEGVGGGWLGRHLRARPGPQPTALSAVALGSSMPESLRGAPAAAAVQSFDEFQITPRKEHAERLTPALRALYAAEADAGNESRDPVVRAGLETLSVLDTIEGLRGTKYEPKHRAAYPKTAFGRAMEEVARLVRAGVGLETATVDVGGWDTHFVQGTTSSGAISGRIGELAGGLGAFLTDLKDRRDNVTVVVMTEFGRRVAENSSFGTDHGRGGVMFVAGGGIAGGQVHGEWPGLKLDQREDGLDLRVTTDYRTVLGEILTRRCGQTKIADVFPGHTLKPIGVCRS